jgi:hypothetical protein
MDACQRAWLSLESQSVSDAFDTASAFRWRSSRGGSCPQRPGPALADDAEMTPWRATVNEDGQ